MNGNSFSSGEVSFWCLDNEDSDLKSYDSSTVSVISNTAICEPCFYLGEVEIAYRKEYMAEAKMLDLIGNLSLFL